MEYKTTTKLKQSTLWRRLKLIMTQFYRIKGEGGVRDREQDSQKSLNFIHSVKVIGGGGGRHSISTFYSVK